MAACRADRFAASNQPKSTVVGAVSRILHTTCPILYGVMPGDVRAVQGAG